MDVFELRDHIIADYRRYIRSFLRIRDERVRKLVDEGLDAGHLWPEPLIQLNPSFEPGPAMGKLVDAGELSPECLDYFRLKSETGADLGPLQLHRHQAEALQSARQRRNYVLTTGTGSGKSLAYILPIVDDVVRNPDLKGLRAIIVYPMNALANSQVEELDKFLGDSPVRYRSYTGQTPQPERESIRADPPHILLTNYVMLELLLTREEDKKLFRSTEHLRFLVFDELHTYRGRQGADVAMLIRRARSACRSRDIVHVGTSATLAQGDSWSEQQSEVADFASQIFGISFLPADIIGETLRRRTPDWDFSDPKITRRLRSQVEGSDGTDLLDSWLETTLGLKRDRSGRWVRQDPMPLAGAGGLSTQLATTIGVEESPCREELRSFLLAAARHRELDGRPKSAFRLHQFVSKGGAVYATAEGPKNRDLTLRAQRFSERRSEQRKPLLPLAFCRECGQDYLVVRRQTLASGDVVYLGRELNERVLEGDQEAGYLLVEPESWPRDSQAAILRLPGSWLEEARGKLRVRRARKGSQPQEVTVDARGLEQPGASRALFLKSPFLFCVCCGVSYAPTARSDFGKLANLGSEGRSTATTVLGLASLREIRRRAEQETARKLLSFTDNRQDASLQAGHFNDFVEMGLLRSALFRAAEGHGTAGLRHDELTLRVFQALGMPRQAYASHPEARLGQKEETDRALRDVLGYFVYRDLQKGWRVNQPNLEQCGLLRVDYQDLDKTCADLDAWVGCDEAFLQADGSTRFEIVKVVLDALRRDLAIYVTYLQRPFQEQMAQRTQLLTERWQVDDIKSLVKSRIALARAARGRQDSREDYLFLSGRGAVGQFLRRRLPSLEGVARTNEALQSLFVALERTGFLKEVMKRRSDKDPPGYQLTSHKMIWRADSGHRAFHDPLHLRDLPEGGLQTNRFFVDFYRSDNRLLLDLEAREHTAQVRVEDRQDREARFRAATLPLLFCSPTMELGVDIRDLNVVHLRNVPPTPANYAQRSGRAGRSGHPALVLTYCSTGSPHDKYFFKRPEKMVAGKVQRPRLDLTNEDLLRAHVHAIWLAASTLSFGTSMKDVLQVTFEAEELRLQEDVLREAHDPKLRQHARKQAWEALGTALKDTDLEPSASGWLDRVLSELPLSLDRACERWRELFLSTADQLRRQETISRDLTRSADDRRKAKRLRDEAERKLNLLLDSSDQGSHSDFYPYRYLASEGFLPGYSFPRLPVTAYLPARRVGGRERNDVLNRPRFLAVAEFGPKASVYHEGSRYVIHRVNLLAENNESLIEGLAQCSECGYVHDLQGDQAPDVCVRCGERRLKVLGNLFRMRNVDTVRRDRIQCDEEERRRLGYDLQTGLRFPQRHGRRSQERAVLELEGDGVLPIGRLTYGAAAEIFRFNMGPRHSRKRNGFVLDLERGYWANENTLEQDDEARESPLSAKIQRVVPYVRDHRNILVFEPRLDGKPDPCFFASLQAALKTAIQVTYELEDSELVVEPLPSREDRRALLFFESAEGGAGVLRRLVHDADAVARVAQQALEICHWTEGGHSEVEGISCVGACYDCLMSYSNQRDHELLDRDVIRPFLAELTRARAVREAGSTGRDDHLDALRRLTDSELERKFLDLLDQHKLTLPTDAQVLLEECGTRVDFLYRDQGAAIFVDGPHHDRASQLEEDQNRRECLEDLGWTVVTFHHAADWMEETRRFPDLFGRLPAPKPEPVPTADVDPFDPDLFDPKWLPFLEELRSRGAVVQPGRDILSEGRVLGQTVARIELDSRTVDLIDASEEQARSLVDQVELSGIAVEVIRSDVSESFMKRLLASS